MSSAEDHERAFDANPLACSIFDRETLRFLRVNPAQCALYGYSEQEFLALTIRDIRPSEDVPRLQGQMAEMLNRPPPFTVESRHRKSDGSPMEVVLRISRLEFDGRNAALVVVQDVTSERAREHLLRLVVEHSTEGVSVVAPDGRMLYMSPGGERLLGLPPGWFAGRDARTLMHPDNRREMPRVLPGETQTNVIRTRHGDGTFRWVEATATNLTLDPAVRGFVTNFRDVTSRIETEESLRRSEANFRMLADSAPVMMMVHRDGKIVYVNPAAIRALGFDRSEELVGQPLWEMVHPDDHESVKIRIKHTAAHGGGAPGEARMRRRDGSYIVLYGEGIVFSFDGQLSHVVVGQDVTERAQLFAKIALTDRLSSVGTLAAGVAHEINNPLAYVSSNLELLARELPALLAGKPSALSPREVESLLADARDGADRVGEIVRDLRMLSRANEETGAVDISAVLGSCVKIALNELRHRARVTTDLAPGLAHVTGTPSRIGQVFLNLLVNAAQAIPEGSPERHEVGVRARCSIDGAYVIVEIADTGAGIPAHVIDRIFDPFFTTKPVGLGTGLGLSISHGIVRSLGGAITVDSKVGVGTRFRVTLPVATAVEVTPEAAAVPKPPVATRVLVIDDEQLVGRSIELLLAPEYQVTRFERAKEALARIQAGETFDAIVCDVMMPEMTGIDFFDRLATVAPEAQRRILFLTGGAFSQQAREFLETAAVPQLAKPFSEAALRRAIDAIRAR